MNFSESTQAILLLTAHFAKPVKGAVKPLTPTEWGRFALWLKEEELSPDQLLKANLNEALGSWQDKTITLERIQGLLERGHSLALAMEKWQRVGIWVLTRSDECYPKALKARLKTAAPPVFFGIGNPDLLKNGGLAVVGSRKANAGDLQFTDALGAESAKTGVTIVSGGAKGVDETAMLGALNNDGTSIGVIAHSLLKEATSKRWRQHLTSNSLVLISPSYPEAGFNGGLLMGRNKYVYCMANAAFVVHSGPQGGTWNGAIENLKKKWVPLWVKPTEDQSAGNQGIVDQGAVWSSVNIDEIDVPSLLSKPNSEMSHDATSPLLQATFDELNNNNEKNSNQINFDNENTLENHHESDQIICERDNDVTPNERQEDTSTNQLTHDEIGEEIEAIHEKSESLDTATPTDIKDNETIECDLTAPRSEHVQASHEKLSIYQFFLEHLKGLCREKPISQDDAAEQLSLKSSQVKAWLEQAQKDGHISKLSRPVRYEWIKHNKAHPEFDF